MQDYISLAEKNGVTLLDHGACQFCGAKTNRGIHECMEIFNLGFQAIDFSQVENHVYRFFIVDAHCLQHPEVHGRWSNHFHLTRLHLIFEYKVEWNYGLSPKLSDYLNRYKSTKKDEFLLPPPIVQRGGVTSTDVLRYAEDSIACKEMIGKWARKVYQAWQSSLQIVDGIAKAFLEK